MTEIRDRIKQCLDAQAASARSIALKAGIGEDSMKNIMRGRSKHPRSDTLAKLAAALEVRVEWLATGDGPQERQENRSIELTQLELQNPPSSEKTIIPSWILKHIQGDTSQLRFIEQGTEQYIINLKEVRPNPSGLFAVSVADQFDLLQLRLLPDGTYKARPLQDPEESFSLLPEKTHIIGRIIWKGRYFPSHV